MIKATVIAASVFFAASLAASVAVAANTGFKLSYPLFYGPAGVTNSNWVSLPYHYFPDGNVAHLPQNAIDACVDFESGGPPFKIASIARFDTLTDSPRTKFCWTPLKVFDLVKGEGYVFVPNVAGFVLSIVGSHDDDFASNKGGTATISLKWTPTTTNGNLVSVPYHALAGNAFDLCTELNGGVPSTDTTLLSISRFDPALDSPRTKFCRSRFKGFDVIPGEAYSFVPNGGPKEIDFDVY